MKAPIMFFVMVSVLCLVGVAGAAVTLPYYRSFESDQVNGTFDDGNCNGLDMACNSANNGFATVYNFSNEGIRA